MFTTRPTPLRNIHEWVFFFLAMSTYNKPYLTFDQQLDLLKSRGLGVTDDARALFYFQHIGYYRLSAYWYLMRQMVPLQGDCTSSSRLDTFQPGSTFDQALALYVFDKRLRLLTLDAVERIEVALRVDVAYLLGEKDPFAHKNPELLDGNFTRKFKNNTQCTHYQCWIDKHSKVIARSNEDFVRHYKNKYGVPFPIWVVVELWEFGMLSTFFQGMKINDRNIIAARYGIPNGRLMQSWLRALNFVRNVAAHHSRLWNKNLIDQPKLPKLGAMPDFDPILGQPNVGSRVFVVFCILLYLMRTISPNSSWPVRLRELLDSFPVISGVSLADMGFPDNWYTQPLWK